MSNNVFAKIVPFMVQCADML